MLIGSVVCLPRRAGHRRRRSEGQRNGVPLRNFQRHALWKKQKGAGPDRSESMGSFALADQPNGLAQPQCGQNHSPHSHSARPPTSPDDDHSQPFKCQCWASRPGLCQCPISPSSYLLYRKGVPLWPCLGSALPLSCSVAIFTMVGMRRGVSHSTCDYLRMFHSHQSQSSVG
jgi:hypothetical protein